MPRNIDPRERSGVLHPENLARYSAGWIEPHPDVAGVVDRYWHVQWNLAEPVPQRIIASPAVTLTVERGEVPAPLVITGVYGGAWERTIAGSGDVFAIRLRPAGLAVVSDLEPGELADLTLALTPTLDARGHGLVASLPDGTPEQRARAADDAIRALLGTRPISRSGLLANAVVDELSRAALPVAVLADLFATSERTIQRALRSTLGQGPKWVARWLRLQDVVRLLSLGAPPSEVAAQLGFADQSHLTNEFRRAVGMTPGAYLASHQQLMG